MEDGKEWKSDKKYSRPTSYESEKKNTFEKQKNHQKDPFMLHLHAFCTYARTFFGARFTFLEKKTISFNLFSRNHFQKWKMEN